MVKRAKHNWRTFKTEVNTWLLRHGWPIITDWQQKGQIPAYVNHGRWVADCPCGGAELVAEGRRMVCGSCGLNSPVTFPANTDEIERVLHDRRDTAARNWYPGETVEMLEAENMENA